MHIRYPTFMPGMFVRMNPRLNPTRRDRNGKDGFVHKDLGQDVVLSFGADRFMNHQGIPASLPECWAKSDTQLESLGFV